jgi:hypothetical protein
MPQGQFPTILAGQDYTASLLQSMVPQFGWKTSSTVYSSATLADDADLLVASVAANAYYDIRAVILYETAVSGDPGLQAAFYGPTGATWDITILSSIVPGGTISPSTSVGTGAFELHCNVASTATGAILEGTLITGAGSGAFGLQFAEHTSGDAVTVLPGSKLSATRMA